MCSRRPMTRPSRSLPVTLGWQSSRRIQTALAPCRVHTGFQPHRTRRATAHPLPRFQELLLFPCRIVSRTARASRTTPCDRNRRCCLRHLLLCMHRRRAAPVLAGLGKLVPKSALDRRFRSRFRPQVRWPTSSKGQRSGFVESRRLQDQPSRGGSPAGCGSELRRAPLHMRPALRASLRAAAASPAASSR